jgi:hypothetical protein
MKPESRLVRVLRSHDEIEATHLAQTLQESGIQAVATGGSTAGFRAEAPGYVDVLIHEKDLPRAKKILESMELESGEVDWSQVDVGQPRE